MKNLILGFFSIAFICSCNHLIIPQGMDKEKAKSMISTANAPNNTYKHVQQFGDIGKTFKKLGKAGKDITFFQAIYVDDLIPDEYRKKGMPTILIKIIDREGQAKYVDFRDLHYKNDKMDNSIAAKFLTSSHMCPEPPCDK